MSSHSFSATTKKDRIISLLGHGISPTVVASAVGVDPSYVSQLLELPEVQEAVSLARSQSIEENLSIDSTIKQVEKAAVERLKNQLIFARTPLETARIFQILNSARRHAEETSHNGRVSESGAITITLPATAVSQLGIRLNSSSQIIEVDGKTMAPMPSKSLSSLSDSKLKLANAAKVEDAIAKVEKTISDIDDLYLNGVRCVI